MTEPAIDYVPKTTRLGNVLRAAEGYAGRVYGMDAPFWWPRLWPLLPEERQQAVDVEERADLVARIQDSTLHTVICPACGESSAVGATLMYHDRAAGYLLRPGRGALTASSARDARPRPYPDL